MARLCFSLQGRTGYASIRFFARDLTPVVGAASAWAKAIAPKLKLAEAGSGNSEETHASTTANSEVLNNTTRVYLSLSYPHCFALQALTKFALQALTVCMCRH